MWFLPSRAVLARSQGWEPLLSGCSSPGISRSRSTLECLTEMQILGSDPRPAGSGEVQGSVFSHAFQRILILPQDRLREEGAQTANAVTHACHGREGGTPTLTSSLAPSPWREAGTHSTLSPRRPRSGTASPDLRLHVGSRAVAWPRQHHRQAPWEKGSSLRPRLAPSCPTVLPHQQRRKMVRAEGICFSNESVGPKTGEPGSCNGSLPRKWTPTPPATWVGGRWEGQGRGGGGGAFPSSVHVHSPSPSSNLFSCPDSS